MARITGGGMIGELSGKLGGNVFARNRGGAYIRQYVMPIDPATLAQLNARNKFGESSSSYHALTPGQKAGWQNFANSVFNPKTGRMGVPSGFNAFVSLQNSIKNVVIPTNFSIDMSGPVIGTEHPLSPSFDAPAFALESTLLLDNGSIRPLAFGGFMSSLSGNYTGGTLSLETQFTINILGGGTGPAGDFNDMKDAKGNLFGYKLFMSNPVAQPGMFIQNPYLIQLAGNQGQTITTPVPGATDFQMQYTGELSGDDYSALPQIGQYVQLTVFMFSNTGMLLRVGSEIKQLEQS